VLRPPHLEPIPTASGPRPDLRAGFAGCQARPPPVGERPGQQAARRHPRGRLPTPAPTLFNEYLRAKSYKAIYDRLANSAEGQTAEGRLVLYEILRQCATITEGRRPGFKPNPPKRDEFVNSLPATDPQREQRIAAFDQYATDYCAGFEGVSMRQADLMKLLDDAAAAGDPRRERSRWSRSSGRRAAAGATAA
jgi:hypothetical protein